MRITNRQRDAVLDYGALESFVVLGRRHEIFRSLWFNADNAIERRLGIALADHFTDRRPGDRTTGITFVESNDLLAESTALSTPKPGRNRAVGQEDGRKPDANDIEDSQREDAHRQEDQKRNPGDRIAGHGYAIDTPGCESRDWKFKQSEQHNLPGYRQQTTSLKNYISGRLCEDIANDCAGHVREPEIAARVTIGQFLAVEAEQGQHRSVKVVHAGAVFAGAKTKLIRCAVSRPAANAAAGKPDAKPVMIVIASQLGFTTVAQLD